MRWQNWLLVLILPILQNPISLDASTQKINTSGCKEIIKFSLFNYDNLIADHYEKKTDYIGQLAYLLRKNTGCPTESITTILNSNEVISESNPVRYMIIINKKTKALCGYYFLDD